jgi:hypothetical protein
MKKNLILNYNSNNNSISLKNQAISHLGISQAESQAQDPQVVIMRTVVGHHYRSETFLNEI